MINVMIVDDQPRELEGIRSIIRWDELDMHVAAVARSAADALVFIRQNAIDLVITDVMMPDMDGLALIQELRAALPWIKVICISCFDDFKFVSGAVNLGACGYLLKPILSSELRALLQRVREDILREQQARRAMPSADSSGEGENETASFSDAHRCIQRVLANIEAHYTEDAPMSVIMEGVYLSRGYMNTLFKNETGMTLHQYILNRRLESAAELLLQDKQEKIYDIAWKCGFADASHLINAFRQKYHCTPAQYRKKNKELAT